MCACTRVHLCPCACDARCDLGWDPHKFEQRKLTAQLFNQRVDFLKYEFMHLTHIC